MTTQNNRNINLHLFKNVNTIFKRYTIPALMLTLLLGKTAVAQERTITLNEAIKLGQQNSKVLKLSQSKIDEAISQYNQARDLSKPTGSASFGYNRAQIPANSLNLGGSTFNLPSSANAYLGTLSANELIFNGNKF